MVNKSKYGSASDFIKDNSALNVFPIIDLISIIEEFNWRIIIKDREIDFEAMSESSYDRDIGYNPFWFQQYMMNVLKIA